MGIVLDSTFFISAERRQVLLADALIDVRSLFPNDELIVSVISLMELSHGRARADTPLRAQLRDSFLQQVMATLKVSDITPSIALRAGTLDAELKKSGIQIATPDLLIAATALQMDFAVLTRNIRHFDSVPGLRVIAQDA